MSAQEATTTTTTTAAPETSEEEALRVSGNVANPADAHLVGKTDEEIAALTDAQEEGEEEDDETDQVGR